MMFSINRQKLSPTLVEAITATSMTVLTMKTEAKQLDKFINNILKQSKVTPLVVVVALIYLHKLREVLPKDSVGGADTCHRLFLSAILIASKSCYDYCLKTKKLARYTHGIYSTSEIFKMEMSMLKLLNFDTRVTQEHIDLFLLANKMDAIEIGLVNS
eukprot:NODE_619_length_5923_cov_0.480769.p3 type:complete len:158 gc:universal NODE_619_length_5923_cov_0.480769:4752-4279(-)